MEPTDHPVDLDGRVAVVTGAGAGLGRAEALALATAGASVVVNDVDAAEDRLKTLVEEITAQGVRAAAVPGDIAEGETAKALITRAEEFGGPHVVVNNAGLLRDRMIFGMSEQEWDLVIRVHLRGHFLTTRLATALWREKSKQSGAPVSGRIVNTASEAFLLGSPGQPNYAAAKAGITGLTLATAQGCARYGVTANAICPRARTAMTEAGFPPAPQDGPDPFSVDQVTPLVVYLASAASQRVNGQVFVVYGGRIGLVAAPVLDEVWAAEDFTDASSAAWQPQAVGRALGPFFAERDPRRTYVATDVLRLTEPR